MTLGTVLRRRDAGGGEVFAGARFVPETGRWVGKVEANPSRLADPDGCGLLAAEDTQVAVRQMLGLAAEAVGWSVACDPGEARVRRVDVARDFRGVQCPSFFVRGLLNVRRRYARRTYLYADPARGNAETLWAGTETGGCRLYDQHAAYAARGASEGSLRWEVEARGGWLEKVGIGSVADLGVESLGALARSRWEWSRMGEAVTGTVEVVEAVDRLVRLGELSSARADRLLGMLVRESLGVSRRVSNDTASVYEGLKRRLGVRPSAELFGGGTRVAVAGRLDYESGREVAA